MTPEERVTTLRAELRTVAARFCAACTELEPLAAELADLEGRLRAAEHQAGIYHDPSPPARELVVEVLHYAVQALTPFVPMVSHDAAALAAAQLTGAREPSS